VRHTFRYPVSFLYFDLASSHEVFARSRWLSDPGLLGDDAARRLIHSRTGVTPSGPIRVLTTPKTLRYSFNPISLYFAYGTDGVEPPTIVAEVTNIPWHERHHYVLPSSLAKRDGALLRFRTAKEMHVSPFMPMDCDYAWEIEPPAERLRVSIANERAGRRVFGAELALERRPLTDSALARMFWRNPLGGLRVTAAIHWQALRLFMRGAPFHAHPEVSHP